MEELAIFEFQAETIENTLRLVANNLNSHTKETCLDRDIMQSLEMIRNVLKKDINKHVPRM